MENVLLTGGAGYIGTHVAVELLEAGCGVIIADNFCNSSPKAVERVEEITGKPVTLVRADVADREAMRKLFSENRVDAVIHLAGLKAVGESVGQPLRYYRNNLDASLTLMEVMKEFGCRRLVFSSSATVYGTENPIPYREDMPAGGCTSPYGWTKFMIERMILDAGKDFDALILRYFNPIGAHRSGRIREMPNGIPNNLMPYITQVACGIRDHLNIYGSDYPTPDGTGVRDFIHVTDLAKGHVAGLKSGRTGIYNLGAGHGLSVMQVVEAFQRVNGVKIPYVIAPRRDGDLPEFYADASKALRDFGWKTELTLEDMVRDSWNWQKNNPRGYDD